MRSKRTVDIRGHGVVEQENGGGGNPAEPRPSRWAVVLAGGEGKRMRPFIRSRLGKDRPKQFCALVGTRSMLQHTIDRANALVPREQVVSVISAGQRTMFTESLSAPFRGKVIEQPLDRGTFTAVFIAAAHVFATDPKATLLILPSDLYLFPEGQFLTYASLAILYAERSRSELAMLGAMPSSPETDYGWIEPFEDCSTSSSAFLFAAAHVKHFHEKPDEGRAEALFRSGCLWNTMMCAARGEALWRLGWKARPKAMEVLEGFLAAERKSRCQDVLEDEALADLVPVYSRLLTSDFSADLLHVCPEALAVFPMHGVNWSDWGRPERLLETLGGPRPDSPAFAFD